MWSRPTPRGLITPELPHPAEIMHLMRVNCARDQTSVLLRLIEGPLRSNQPKLSYRVLMGAREASPKLRRPLQAVPDAEMCRAVDP